MVRGFPHGKLTYRYSRWIAVLVLLTYSRLLAVQFLFLSPLVAGGERVIGLGKDCLSHICEGKL